MTELEIFKIGQIEKSLLPANNYQPAKPQDNSKAALYQRGLF